MLAKQNRLSQTTAIGTVRQNGTRVHGQFCTCFVMHNDSGEPAKFTFIVSKRVSKLAVERNRTKRLLREATQSMIPAIKPGAKVVCIAKTSLDAIPLQQVENDLRHIFTTAHIL